MNATNKIVHVGPFLKRTLGRESRAAVDNDDALIGPRLRLLRTSCQGQMHTEEEEEEEELLFFFCLPLGSWLSYALSHTLDSSRCLVENLTSM